MFTIRKQQVERMQEAMREDYYDRLCRYFRANLPDFVARFDDKQLRKRVAEAVPVARSFGIHSGVGIVKYVGLSLAAGPEFHQLPKVRQFLTLPGRDPERLVHQLLEQVTKDLQARPSPAPTPPDRSLEVNHG
jgi:hypothetical protein